MVKGLHGCKGHQRRERARYRGNNRCFRTDRTYGRLQREIADANGWNILDSQTGDFTQAGGQEVMESYIKSYEGQFNVVVCQNDNEAFGAMDAMKAAGISYGVDGDVIPISFDACTAGPEYVMSGDINADFECNPLAAPFVEDVIQQLESGSTPTRKYTWLSTGM